MKETDFTGSVVGQVKWVYNRRYCYFSANPLPHDFPLKRDIIRRSRKESSAISRLDGKLMQMSERERSIISNILMLREAVYSCRMSNFDVSVDDVFRYQRGAERTDGVKEYLNYRDAMEHGIESVKKNDTISFDLLLQLHKILVGKDRSSWKSAGEMRVDQNAPNGESLETAKFVPMDPGSLPKMMGNWHRYVDNSIDDPVMKVITAHYQFELIQPFMDCNGRVGRLLSMLMLYSEGVSVNTSVYTSEFFCKNKDVYLRRLYRLSSKDEYDEWASFYLDALESQTEEASDIIDRVCSIYDEFISRENKNRAAVVDMLFDNPYLRVEDVMERTGFTRPGALKIIYSLEDDGLIEEISGRQRGRLYVSKTILSALNWE